MKTTLRIIVITSVILIMATRSGNAQVVIGSAEAPVKAALLDLKDMVPDSDNETSISGGLVLPRVKLVSKTTLEPFIAADASEWDATNQAETKSDHVGLTVYNLTSNGSLNQGVYVWSGNEWNPLKVASNYIYLPAFNLTWGGNPSAPLNINLFDVYKNNFNPASTNQHVNSRDANVFALPEYNEEPSDYYYVVTDYHPAIEIHDITSVGEMSYSKATSEAANPVPPENVYVNVVMIRK